MKKTKEKNKRYKVIESPMGFSVEGGSDRVTVNISLRDAHWLLEDELGMHQEKFGFFEVTKFAKVASGFLLEYCVDKVVEPEIKHIDKHKSTFLLSKFLCKVISTQLQRLKPKIDPTILDVQRTIFASTMGCGKIAKNPEFYTTASKFLLNDILKYRPAAVATRYLGEPLALDYFSVEESDLDLVEVEEGYRKFLFEACGENNLHNEFDRKQWRNYYSCVPYEQRISLPFGRCVELLENWKLLYSPDRTSYTALNKTLMNCPAVPPRSLLRLRNDTLSRPISNRIELMLNLECAYLQRHKKILTQSSVTEICKALKILRGATHNVLSTRSAHSISFLVEYVNDYRVDFQGRLSELVRRSVRWHREQSLIKKEEALELHGDRPAAFPPIPLPESNEKLKVRFLDTVAAIANEGQEMKHCIATYIHKALAGESYLFHIDHVETGQTSVASVEVDRCGRVIQARGPENFINTAATQGESLLREWGKKIAANHPGDIFDAPF